jgi:hypothetical protein
MTNSSIKPATWFWVVSAIALVWNLMGAIAYVGQMMMSPEAIQALPENERALYESVPSWATSAFAFAVWGGTLGCILLLIRKKIATPVLMLSLIGILVQMYHSFFVLDSMAVYGPGGIVMPIMVIIIGIYLVWFSRSATSKGWLN